MPMTASRAKITFLLGCTGCGKGAVGRALARRIGAEIVSVDSMKVFRRMDIGTAKPTPAERAEVPHHLIDVVEPSEEFSVAQFVQCSERVIAALSARGRHVLCVGGTALYIKALSEGLFEGPSADPQIRERLQRRAGEVGIPALHAELAAIDPAAAGRIHRNDLRRIVRALEVYELTGRPITALQTQWDRSRERHDCTFIGLRRDRQEQAARANERVRRMIELGLVAEVAALFGGRPAMSTTARQALGYAEIIEYLEGKVPLEDAVEKIKINTRRFVKAQRTWFRRFQRTRWIDVPPGAGSEQIAEAILRMEHTPWST